MTYLALRNLFQNRFRLILSISGVALSIALIVLLRGFLSGIYVQVTAYLDNTPVDWVISQEGIRNLLGGTSFLPPSTEDLVQGISGVEDVVPIVAQYAILDIHNEKVVGYMVGYDPDIGGGPWSLLAGRELDDEDEIILDWVMAEDHGLKIGDDIEILDEEFEIVGLSADTSSWMANFFFVKKEAAEQLLLAPEVTSFLLITAKPGYDKASIEARLRRRLQDVEILPSRVVKQNDLDLLVNIFAVPLKMMVSIAFAVGTAILGMIIYTATVSRAGEYGVLKAVGGRNVQLYSLVVQQALLISVVGLGLGILLAWIAGQGVMEVYPKFLVVLRSDDLLPTIVTGIGMGLGAALLPALYLSRLDPAEVFRR